MNTRFKVLFLLVGTTLGGWLACQKNAPDYRQWTEYLGGPERNHYSTLSQITRDNVHQLQVAWTYTMPDSGQLQTNPIVVDGVLYGITPSVQAFALDAATGRELWRFGDPLKVWHSTGRGVAYWSEGDDKRILHTIGPRLYALDARTGMPISTFGEGGFVDLHTGLPEVAQAKFIISNTPGTIYKNLIIMPLRVSEDADAAPGDIRAFDVKTGQLAWTFHTIPHPGEMGYGTFPDDAYQNTYTGAANNWAGMAVDTERGIVYVPTGSASYDFYGGFRAGKNLFSNCLLALDAPTGKLRWHYQFVHHDIWDRDAPAPPNLLTINPFGEKIDVVAQVTKQGYVYVFDRVTGRPIFPIDEVAVPPSALKGEQAWETQPIPRKPAPYARQVTELTEADIPHYVANRESLVQKFRSYRKDRYAPPSLEGTLLFPGYDGGAEWGGAAVDVETGVMYVNANEMAWVLQMTPQPEAGALDNLSPGEKIYATKCANCHKPNLTGDAQSGYPNLKNIADRRNKTFVNQIVSNGKGMMPGFPALSAEEKNALIDFLFDEEKKEVGGDATPSGLAADPRTRLPFKSTGYNKFLDTNGLPAFSPPYGTLTAIDLNSGQHLWRIPFGEDERLKPLGVHNSGVENYGGAVVTQNGLLFIAATKDGKFRCFDKKTGQLLWETTLPAAAFATPAMYEVNGKQYIALPCGGTKLGTPKGNTYVAFALP
jgi:quinoprotein glucose dehydrogenase